MDIKKYLSLLEQGKIIPENDFRKMSDLLKELFIE